MFRRAIVAIWLIALIGCAPWHIFASGSPCKHAIKYHAHRIAVGTTTVRIGTVGADETIQIGQVDVGPDVAREASDVVKQFDDLQVSNCQTMQALKSKDRAPYAQLQTQLLTDFAFVIKGLGRATTEPEYTGALADARARLGSDGRATAQVGRQ